MEQFTQKAKEALQLAYDVSEELGHGYIGSEHLLCGIIREQSCVAAQVLNTFGINEASVMPLIERLISGRDVMVSENSGYTPSARHILEQSCREAAFFRSALIGTEHILIAMLKQQDCVALRILNTLGASAQAIYQETVASMGEDVADLRDSEASGQARKKNSTPTLNQYSRDLTDLAREGKLDPVIGRQNEIMRVVQILSRRTKNNPCLIGEPGVGKTAVVEGLATLIVEDKVPSTIKGKRLLSLDISGMVAGSKYRGEFEERIKRVIAEAQNDGDVLLFIDEIHTIIGAGGAEGALDAANILKPSLARGELQIIGATTVDDYRKHIEKDSALERRFQPVMVDEPTEEETIDILKGIRHKYEEFHGVTITDEACEAAVKMSERYINDRFLPDKAIDLIDEAASKLRLDLTAPAAEPEALKRTEKQLSELRMEKELAVIQQDFDRASAISKKEDRARKRLDKLRLEDKEKQEGDMRPSLGEAEIADVVSSWTKIPVTKLTEAESVRIRNLENILHERIVSQDEAVKAVSKAIKRGRVGIKDPRRPIGSFMFLGPTGVGKTELSKALAEAVFGSENALIRVDMSEYMEKHSVSKMIGSPPGYVGFEEGGQLSEKVRRNPYSVVLFDEIEKAHPDVFNVLLQVLDDGCITDAQGRKVDFKNTIIIMTSNAGAQNIVAPKMLGFMASEDADASYNGMKQRVMDEVRQMFKPEFLNRIDEIIVFRQLTRENMGKIVDIMLKDVTGRMKTQMNISAEISDDAKQLLIERGYDEKYGARPLKREIQTLVEDNIAEEMLEGNIKAGDTVLITADPASKDSLKILRLPKRRKKTSEKPEGKSSESGKTASGAGKNRNKKGEAVKSSSRNGGKLAKAK